MVKKIHMTLGNTVGNAGPVTEVRSLRQLRGLAARPCKGDGYHDQAECCSPCEARELVGYRSEHRRMLRSLIRHANNGTLLPWERRVLRAEGAAIFYSEAPSSLSYGIVSHGDLLEELRAPSLSESEAVSLLQAAARLAKTASGVVGYALVHGAGASGTAVERCAWLEGALNSALCEEPE